MTIHETIKSGIPNALRAKDEVRLRTLRSLTTLMTNEVVSKKRKPNEFLTDEEALAVLKRASNQRKDSIEQFTSAGRGELAVPEIAELLVIASFLPTLMSRDAIKEVVVAMLSEHGPIDTAGAGKFMGLVMKTLVGRADGPDVKAVIDELVS